MRQGAAFRFPTNAVFCFEAPNLMETKPIPDELLTVNEVAARLRVHRQTVYKAIWRGKLPVVRFGRAMRVSESALAEFTGGSN
jgi:excisionase family DNA binding protein